MKRKNSLRFWILLTYVFIYILMILVFFWLNYWASETKNIFRFPSVVLHISPIVMILFGIILNFERIIRLMNGKGKISMDWLRLVIVVVPLTCISFLYVVQYLQNSNPVMLTYFIRPPIMYVAQFLQGFFLVSCFSKNPDKKGLENG